MRTESVHASCHNSDGRYEVNQDEGSPMQNDPAAAYAMICKAAPCLKPHLLRRARARLRLGTVGSRLASIEVS